MFSPVRQQVFSNKDTCTRLANTLLGNRKLGLLITSNVENVDAEVNGQTQFLPPVDLETSGTAFYSTPGKSGCHETGGDMKSESKKDFELPQCPQTACTWQHHKPQCPISQRPPQPCNCLINTDFSHIKLGKCPGPCPRIGKPCTRP